MSVDGATTAGDIRVGTRDNRQIRGGQGSVVLVGAVGTQVKGMP